MVKLIKREGKLVLPTEKREYDKEAAKKRLYHKFGKMNISGIKFTPIRKDGTRGVSFLLSGQKASYSYLTDLR